MQNAPITTAQRVWAVVGTTSSQNCHVCNGNYPRFSACSYLGVELLFLCEASAFVIILYRFGRSRSPIPIRTTRILNADARIKRRINFIRVSVSESKLCLHGLIFPIPRLVGVPLYSTSRKLVLLRFSQLYFCSLPKCVQFIKSVFQEGAVGDRLHRFQPRNKPLIRSLQRF